MTDEEFNRRRAAFDAKFDVNAPENADIKEFERIDKMTPDEAYRYSVETSGLEGFIPDKTASVAPAQPAAPATPAKPVANDGKNRTTFGGKVRVVDQKTGVVTWEDTNGNAIATPDSEVMRGKLGGDIGNINRPFSSWDDAIRQQSAEQMAKSQAYADSAAAANMKARDLRKKRRDTISLSMGDMLGSAMADLDGNMESAKAGGGGLKTDKNGNFFVQGIVRNDKPEDGAQGEGLIDALNAKLGKLGATDTVEQVYVRQRVNKDGEPVGEPTFHVRYRKNGMANANGDGEYIKTLGLAEAMDEIVRVKKSGGASDDDAHRYAVHVFRANPYGWATEPDEPASVKAARLRGESAERIARENNETKKLLADLKSKDDQRLAADKNLSAERRARIRAKQEEARQLAATIRTMTTAMGERSVVGEQKNRYTREEIDAKQTELNNLNKEIDGLFASSSDTPAPAASPAAAAPVESATSAASASPTPASSGDNVIDVSNIKDKAELNAKLKALPDGSTVTLGGVTKTKRNGRWETTK